MKLENEQIFGDYKEKQKGILTSARRWIEENMLQRPSIDKLLRDKVDDYIIIRELPLPIKIGDRTIYVGTFTLETQDVFFKEYVKLLAMIGARHGNLELGIKFLSNGAELYKLLSNDKKVRKSIYRLIKSTILEKQNYLDPISGKLFRLPKVSLGYFRKHVTIDEVMQICMLIYIYNFDATRRSLNILMGEMGVQLSGANYTFSWLQNLAGLSGKFLLNQLASEGLPLSVPLNDPPETIKQDPQE